MEKITGFHLDEDNHWVADLSCGHTQHVRNNPPWQQREWVLSDNGCNDFIGFEFECKSCRDDYDFQ
ncbi:DUF3565 domain-containing protein [Candidatus Thioglobus sp.]|nr:DUF3565 domain-containing protein [Candidatus Thioglobus sp.]